MIKICKEKFDMKVINAIYSTIIEGVEDRIDAVIKGKNTCVKKVLKDTFYEGSTISREKIDKYLKADTDLKLRNHINTFSTRNGIDSPLNDDTFSMLLSFMNLGNVKIKNISSNLQKKKHDVRLTDQIMNQLLISLKPDDLLTSAIKRKIVTSSYCRYKDLLAYDSIIEGIFDYSNLSDNQRHSLLHAMNVKVCPYCNRQYITSYSNKKGKNKTTADLDHFYPKSLYPALALSLYNFIPSCQICNSRFKLAYDPIPSDMKILYPYEEDFGDDCMFSVNTIESYLDPKLLLASELKVNVKYSSSIDDSKKAKIDRSCKVFHLEELYKIHNNIAYEVVSKYKMYPPSKIKALVEDFDEMIDKDYDLAEIIFGHYKDARKHTDKPLSKFTLDIYNELAEVDRRERNGKKKHI